jgi:hypothetical protein
VTRALFLLVTILVAFLIWLPTAEAQVYVTPTGNDANLCTATAPCRTWQRGYRVALPGQTVYLGAGSYPAQSLLYDSTKTPATHVFFRPVTGAAVTVQSLTFGSDSRQHQAPAHITIGGYPTNRIVVTGDVQAKYNGNRATDIVLENMKMNGGFFHSPYQLTLRNIEIGPKCCSVDALNISIPRPGAPTPEKIVLDRLYIHDIVRKCQFWPGPSPCPGVGDSDAHVDCVQLFGGIDVTVKNSRFYNCATQALFFRQSSNGGTYRNLTIENNVVGAVAEPGGGIILSYNGACDFGGFVKLRYNSSVAGYRLDAGAICSGTAVNMVANTGYFTQDACTSAGVPVTFEYNVFTAAKCSASDVKGQPGYVRTALINPDLHLAPGALAIGKGKPGDFPATDLDGQLRPGGTLPDAGADEV